MGKTDCVDHGMLHMSACLDEEKAAQITARFLKHTGGTDTSNYTKLIKLLYLADRDALKRWNRPLTGDRYCWMDNGPVLSGILDRIRGTLSPPCETFWDSWFVTTKYDIRIKDNPGDARLSMAERELIDSLFERFRDHTYGEMLDYTHNLPERLDVSKGGAEPLTYERILVAVGKGQRAERIAEEIEDTNYLRATIGNR